MCIRDSDLCMPKLAPNIKKYKQEHNKISFEIEKNNPSDLNENSSYDIPVFYYEGYKAYYFDSNGHKQKINVTNGYNGFINISTPHNFTGKVFIYYGTSAATLIGRIISILGLFAFIATWFLYYKFNRMNSRRQIPKN